MTGFVELSVMLIWHSIVLTHILNATEIYEFRRSLWMTHALIILMILYLLVVICSKIARRQLDQRLKACVGALLLVFCYHCRCGVVIIKPAMM